jgi:hypothetical protein
MARRVGLMWVVLFAAGAMMPVAAAADGEASRPVNPGFERLDPSGEVVGWRVVAGAAPADVVVRGTAEVARDGAGSLEVAHQQPASTVVVSEPIQLSVGRLYRLSGWIRTAGVRTDAATRYPTSVPACLAMASYPFTNHSRAVGADTDWTRVEDLFIATTSEDRVELRLGHNGTATGTAWFDDIRVEEVDDIADYIPLETVRWSGEGYRYDDRGWIFVHIEGEPYERGYQYGSLVADEIAAYIRKLAVVENEQDPAAGWATLRFEADALFLRGYDREYLTEMRGIADGAAAAGAEYEGRPLDLIDIVTINSVIDLDQLHDAIEVTPNALTGESFLEQSEELAVTESSHKCSAFAATGPATADGRVVFGQIFMWRGYTGVHWNVIADVVPTDGHRLVYHTFPGGIHSGADFYINSAGIVIGETTVAQTPFEPDSTPQSNRIRKAAQYASSIDDVERILWQGNNGMYTNDWPIADVKTDEVAILLLGTHTKKLWRTSEDIAPFGTPGFLWANNNNRDPEVRKEYLAQPNDRPFDLMFSPWNRDVAFNQFYREHAGSIDSDRAVELWASSPVNRAHACDGKITTSEMAEQLVFLAHFGKVTLREKFPTKGWRIMPDLPEAVPHLSLGYSVVSPIFVTEALKQAREAGRFAPPPSTPSDSALDLDGLDERFTIDRTHLWRQTVFPASASDGWFVSASAGYWRLLEQLDPDDPVAAAEELSEELAGLNARYLYTVSREGDLAATEGHRSYQQFGPYLIPRIKGTFALHQLRLELGNDAFLDLMDTIHDRYARREMSTGDLVAVAREVTGREVAPLIAQWIERAGLPELRPTVETRRRRGAWELVVTVAQPGDPYRLTTHLAVTAGGRRQLRSMRIDGPSSREIFTFDQRPTRVELNALNDVPVSNRSFYTWGNFIDDFHDTLIVYGTARQDEANHTLARRWQETVADAYVEILPPLVKDAELTAAQAASHDLMVLSTLDDHALLGRLEGSLPVRFAKNHFSWQGVEYADPEDGLVLVMPSPFDPGHVVYAVVANSALQLHRMTSGYRREIRSWAVFRGEEIVETGHHSPAELTLEFASTD